MINNVTLPVDLFARSAAVNAPLFIGAGIVGGGLFGGAWWALRETDKRDNKRAFVRSVAASPDITDELLMYFQNSPDPIRDGLRMLAEASGPDLARTAIRAALAKSL